MGGRGGGGRATPSLSNYNNITTSRSRVKVSMVRKGGGELWKGGGGDLYAFMAELCCACQS